MILCHGEMLIDFIPTEARDGELAYRPAVGGSPGNVALTIARLDVPAGFVGGLSRDFFGEQIASTLTANGVAMDYVSRLDRPTMLAFVDLSGEEPRYAFYDYESAPRNWRLEDMPPIADDVKALHFGSLSLIRLPAANAFAELHRREAGRRIISFDPNIRAGLVEDEADYRARLSEILHLADVIKLSGADLVVDCSRQGHRRACPEVASGGGAAHSLYARCRGRDDLYAKRKRFAPCLQSGCRGHGRRWRREHGWVARRGSRPRCAFSRAARATRRGGAFRDPRFFACGGGDHLQPHRRRPPRRSELMPLLG